MVLENIFKINDSATIGEAMEAISDNHRGAILVVNNGVLSGVLSDGDIRRAIVRGATLITPIAKIVNTACVLLDKKDENEEAVKQIFIAHPQITLLPIVDDERFLVKIYYKDDSGEIMAAV